MRPGSAWKAALGLLGAAVLFYFIAMAGRTTRSDQPLPPAPELTLPDLAGKPVSLSSYKGRVVLLDFWATWCEPCQEEIPELRALDQRFKGRDFAVIGVSLDTLGARAVSAFVRERKIPYAVLLAGGEPPEGFPIPGLPTAFLIDKKGLIVRRYLGPKLMEDVGRDVEEQLAR